VRIVLDTNVVIAGLLWRGKPSELLGHAVIWNVLLKLFNGTRGQKLQAGASLKEGVVKVA
jgi:predicted nucleic acid-binding protein